MQKTLHILSLFLIFLFSSCSKENFEETGFGTIKGRVVEEITFAPIANAKVSTSPSSSIVFTDANGYYTLSNIKIGQYSIQAQKENYIARFESATVLLNTEIQVNLELKKVQKTNIAPTAPILTAPADNAINQPLNPTLTWSATDPENDPLTYTILIKNDKDDEVITINNITTTSYQLTNLKYSTKYFWQIAVSDGTNAQVLSSIFSFKTLDFPLPRFLFTRKIQGNNVIFTANETGESLQITSNSANSYRPKKNLQINRIAFIRTDGSQDHIFTMKPDGSDVLKITNSVPIAGFNMNHVSYSWSGNGSQIMYPNFDKLFKINADGSGLTLFYQAPPGNFISECDWSVDGTRIAIKMNSINGYNAQIIILDANANILQTAVSGFNGAIGSLHFSANNQRLLYTRDISGFESPDYRQLDTNVFVYSLTTNTSTQLALNKTAGTNDLDARYSPNEAEIIIMNTSNDGISQKNIQRVTISGTITRSTLFTNGFMPDWK